jgi:hypothetical protein
MLQGLIMEHFPRKISGLLGILLAYNMLENDRYVSKYVTENEVIPETLVIDERFKWDKR